MDSSSSDVEIFFARLTVTSVTFRQFQRDRYALQPNWSTVGLHPMRKVGAIAFWIEQAYIGKIKKTKKKTVQSNHFSFFWPSYILYMDVENKLPIALRCDAGSRAQSTRWEIWIRLWDKLTESGMSVWLWIESESNPGFWWGSPRESHYECNQSCKVYWK